MNQGRANHAAMVLDKHLYVIGGEAGETLQSSIECRKLDAQSPWELLVMQNEDLERIYPAVCAISSDEIVVFGGRNDDDFFSNKGLIFNTQSYEVTTVLGANSDFSFLSFT